MPSKLASLHIWPPFVFLLMILVGIGVVTGMHALPLILLAGAAVGLWAWISFSWRRSMRRLGAEIRLLDEGGVKHPLEDHGRGAYHAIVDSVNALTRDLNDQLAFVQTQLNEQQAILRSMSNGLIALDRDQRILSLNRAAERLLGIDRIDVRGRLLQEALRQPGLNQFVSEAIASRVQTTGEFTLVGESELVLQAASEPLHDADDNPVGLLILLTDVTTMRRLETLRSDFAANVSHELRTPITNIKGYIETLQEVGVNDEGQTERFLDIIHVNANRLASIIEDLLALSRLEQPGSRETLNPIDLPVQRVLAAVNDQISFAAAAKRIELRFQTDDDHVLRANPQLVEQAVANLVSNAVKYSNAGTSVTISARKLAKPDRGMIEISVTDEGPGIAPQHLSRIFERFYRIDKARSREQGGTGLGLAIVKHIALVHGGRVEVDSRIGRGSTFRLILPAADGGAVSEPRQGPASGENAA